MASISRQHTFCAGTSSMEYKIELIRLGKRQLDLMHELISTKGMKLTQTEMSLALTGNADTPKARKIRAGSDEIIARWKEEQGEE